MQVKTELFEHFLPQYQYLSTIDHGPQSVTLEVLKPSSSKSFALKVFSFDEGLDSAWYERFDGQMPALGELSGVHVERIFHSGRSGRECFCLKDFVSNRKGQAYNLKAYQRDCGGILSDYQVYVVLEQCLKALISAKKSHGFSHGALKPENILIEEFDDQNFRVILSDFQPYKLFTEKTVLAARDEKKLSLQKAFACFDYQAPEYATNEYATVQEDVYSLAVILYELMTASLPWGRFALISPFEEILKIALQQDPSKRYVSYEDFYQALSNIFEPQKPLVPIVRKKQNREGGLTPIGTIYIPKGKYLIGRDDCGPEAKPVHEYETEGFYLERSPVTNAQFAEFVKESAYVTLAEKEGAAPFWTGSEWKLLSGLYWKNPRGQKLVDDFDFHPVVQVSYEDALAYAKWIGRRLPLEQEWELAAKGGKRQTLFPNGDQLSSHEANFASYGTSSVMTYPPNAYGLYDMVGNVWEWCASPYLPYPSSTTKGLDFSQDLRVVRGGAWLYDVFHCRIAARNANQMHHFYPTLGFRCASDPKTS